MNPGRGENGSPWTAGGLCQTELSQILSFDFTCGLSRIASTRIGNVALFEWGMRVNTHTHTICTSTVELADVTDDLGWWGIENSGRASLF